MAVLLDDGSSQYVQDTGFVHIDEPLTLACWFNTNDDAARQTAFGVANSGSTVYLHGLEVDGSSSDRLRVRSQGTSSKNAFSTSSWTVNTWHHACGVFATDTSRTAYLDGGNSAENTDSATVTDLDVATVGQTGESTPEYYFSGSVAEAAIWDVALTAAEVAVLAAGYSPVFVRPASLIFYAPLVRNYNDIVTGRTLTATNGPTVSAHPRIIYPGRRRRVVVPTVAAAGYTAGAQLDASEAMLLGTGGMIGSRTI